MRFAALWSEKESWVAVLRRVTFGFLVHYYLVL
jgi:hypothetical protein